MIRVTRPQPHPTPGLWLLAFHLTLSAFCIHIPLLDRAGAVITEPQPSGTTPCMGLTLKITGRGEAVRSLLKGSPKKLSGPAYTYQGSHYMGLCFAPKNYVNRNSPCSQSFHMCENACEHCELCELCELKKTRANPGMAFRLCPQY
jgi:hypothetical protein